MTQRQHDGRDLLQRVQVVARHDLRIVIGHHQIIAIEADRHLHRRVARAQRGDLSEVRAIEDQHLIGILPQNVEAAPRRVGENVHQLPRRIEEGAAIFRRAIVHQHAEVRPHPGRVALHHSGGGRRRHIDRAPGDHVELVRPRAGEAADGRGVHRNRDPRRRHSSRRCDGQAASGTVLNLERHGVARGIDDIDLLRERPAGAEVAAKHHVFDRRHDARCLIQLRHRENRHTAIGDRVEHALIGVEQRFAGQVLRELNALPHIEVVGIHHHQIGRDSGCQRLGELRVDQALAGADRDRPHAERSRADGPLRQQRTSGDVVAQKARSGADQRPPGHVIRPVSARRNRARAEARRSRKPEGRSDLAAGGLVAEQQHLGRRTGIGRSPADTEHVAAIGSGRKRSRDDLRRESGLVHWQRSTQHIGHRAQHRGGATRGVEEQELVLGQNHRQPIGSEGHPHRAGRESEGALLIVGKVDHGHRILPGLREGTAAARCVMRDHKVVAVGRDGHPARIRRDAERAADAGVGERHHFDAARSVVGNVKIAARFVQSDVRSRPPDGDDAAERCRGAISGEQGGQRKKQ